MFVMMMVAAGARTVAAQPEPAAVSAFNSYISELEARLQQQHRSPSGFVAPEDGTRLRQGEQIIEQLTPSRGPDLPGAMLHHWRGTAFAPGATAAGFERLIQDYAAYPKIYSPQILQARVLAHRDDHFDVMMRIRQKHVITVVLDTTYGIAFGHLDAQHGFSFSRSTRVSEIESPGTRNERALGPDRDHGFLWRLNTYWSYEERDGGLYMQVESVSLTRSIPTGLSWAIRPFVQSVPRESLEFTLQSTINALRK